MHSLSQDWVFSSNIMSFLSMPLWSLPSLCLLSHSVLSSFLLIALFHSFSLFSQWAWLEAPPLPGDAPGASLWPREQTSLLPLKSTTCDPESSCSALGTISPPSLCPFLPSSGHQAISLHWTSRSGRARQRQRLHPHLPQMSPLPTCCDS